MSPSDSPPEEAILESEIQTPPPRNAFTELMTTKRKASSPPPARKNFFRDRMGLGVYLQDPSSSSVIYHNDYFVAINDRYPKATVHTLLLPRSEKHNLLHPFDAFEDADFLASVRAETDKLKSLAAKELRRRLGPKSASDAARQRVLDGAEPETPGTLPPGRDWSSEIVSGVHAVPSMRHLHVHVFSRDMHSEALRHRKHYNSFTTPFLVPLEDFPLPEDDARRDTKKEEYLKWGFKCWRCGGEFGNQFQKLKRHLEDEFEIWKRE